MKIISRHLGAITWLKSKGYNCEVISHLDTPEAGETYIGTLPIPIIKDILDVGGSFILLTLPSVAFSDRGHELTPTEMDAAGATLHKIKNIYMEEVS